MLKAALAGALLAAVVVGVAHAADEAQPAQPIVLKMQPGTDSITVQGVLQQNVDCCTYVFDARAGQQLYWTESGGVVRMVLTAPNGDVAGPLQADAAAGDGRLHARGPSRPDGG